MPSDAEGTHPASCCGQSPPTPHPSREGRKFRLRRLVSDKVKSQVYQIESHVMISFQRINKKCIQLPGDTFNSKGMSGSGRAGKSPGLRAQEPWNQGPTSLLWEFPGQPSSDHLRQHHQEGVYYTAHLRSSLVAQRVKDPVLSLLWLRFDPWPWNFCMLWVQPKKKKGKVHLRAPPEMDRINFLGPGPGMCYFLKLPKCPCLREFGDHCWRLC